MDIASSEAVEADLDLLIERRVRNGEVDPDEREELWKASVRAYTARRREEMRAAWCEYHQDQAERHRVVLEALIARREAAAAQLREAEASNAWSSRYAKTGSGIVPRLSTSTAPRYEVCRCRAIRTD